MDGEELSREGKLWGREDTQTNAHIVRNDKRQREKIYWHAGALP